MTSIEEHPTYFATLKTSQNKIKSRKKNQNGQFRDVTIRTNFGQFCQKKKKKKKIALFTVSCVQKLFIIIAPL